MRNTGAVNAQEAVDSFLDLTDCNDSVSVAVPTQAIGTYSIDPDRACFRACLFTRRHREMPSVRPGVLIGVGRVLRSGGGPAISEVP